MFLNQVKTFQPRTIGLAPANVIESLGAESRRAQTPVRVVMISTLPPVNTSLSEYGKFLAEGLLGASDQLELHVLADEAEGPAPVEMSHPRLRVERCWKLNDWLNPLRLMRRLHALKPDIVLFNLQFASFGTDKIPAMLGLSAPMLAKAIGCRVMTVLHNLPEAMDLDAPCFGRSRFDQALIKAGTTAATHLLLQSDKLVVTLEPYREILSRKYAADNVEVIGLGSYIEPARRLYTQRDNRFLTFGKFGTYKRLEKLLETFTVLSARHEGLELLIGGADHPATPGYLAKIQARYGHVPGVRFIGWIEDEELPQLLREAKALVLSYESTAGSSGPLHLALSQGKPVIAPDMLDFRRVAAEEGAELLFYDAADRDGLEQVLENVISDRVDLEAIGTRNLQVAQQYSCERTARQYTDLIAALLERELPAPAAIWPQLPIPALGAERLQQAS